jgi:hypothetical protein
MLTLQELNDMGPNIVFAQGDIENSPKGAYMTDHRRGDMLSWVAKRGQINDWAIYIHWKESGYDFVKTNGDKILNKAIIQKLVPCTPEVLDQYRF